MFRRHCLVSDCKQPSAVRGYCKDHHNLHLLAAPAPITTNNITTTINTPSITPVPQDERDPQENTNSPVESPCASPSPAGGVYNGVSSFNFPKSPTSQSQSSPIPEGPHYEDNYRSSISVSSTRSSSPTAQFKEDKEVFDINPLLLALAKASANGNESVDLTNLNENLNQKEKNHLDSTHTSDPSNSQNHFNIDQLVNQEKKRASVVLSNDILFEEYKKYKYGLYNKKRDGKLAREILKRLSEGPSPHPTAIAINKIKGYNGFKKQPMQAYQGLLQAAIDGHGPSQFQLGVWLHEGRCMNPEEKLAFHWCLRSAEGGYGEAMKFVADFYLQGKKFLPKSLPLAIHWYTKASELNIPSAQFELAKIYEKGNGVPSDKQVSMEWYRKSAKNGFDPAKLIVRRFDKKSGPGSFIL